MNIEFYTELKNELKDTNVQLITVSKTQSLTEIGEAYAHGIRIFGENKVQELVMKYEQLPKDIQWHFIGHLQSNKIKYIAPFITLIHAVDSLKLLIEIDKQAAINQRIIPCLLQCHIAKEDTKFGLSSEELFDLLSAPAFKKLAHISIHGLMGMATNTDDTSLVNAEFAGLKALFDETKSSFFSTDNSFHQLSMGMSNDYSIAMKHGTTMIRIGSRLFGAR
jgi:hypothetical protein